MDPMPRRPTVEEILKLNPGIDQAQVAGFVAFQEQVLKSGVDISPKYRLSPPLGDLKASVQDRNLTTSDVQGASKGLESSDSIEPKNSR
jgi:hypothetical protein